MSFLNYLLLKNKELKKLIKCIKIDARYMKNDIVNTS